MEQNLQQEQNENIDESLNEQSPEREDASLENEEEMDETDEDEEDFEDEEELDETEESEEA